MSLLNPHCRVNIVSPKYWSGGAERASRELSAALHASQANVTHYVAVEQPDTPTYVKGIRIPLEKYLRSCDSSHSWGDWRCIGSAMLFNRLAKESRRSSDSNLLHLHNIAHNRGNWCSLTALKNACKEIPVVWTLHDEWATHPGISYDLGKIYASEFLKTKYPDICEYLDRSHPMAQKRVNSILPRMPRPDALITPSVWLADLAQSAEHFSGIPVHVVPYGLSFLNQPEVSCPQLAARSRLGLPQKASIILVIAANMMSPFKGIGHAIQLLSRPELSEYDVLIAGNNGRFISESVQQRCFDLGFIDGDENLALCYRAADIVLLPSAADNLPYTALEAMACSRAIAAFEVGGMTELVGNDERGVVSKPFDTDSLAAKIDSAFRSPGMLSTMGDAGNSWVKANCDPDRYLRRTIEIYCDAFRAKGVSRISEA
ncbi:glycosyltransferase [Crateriforma spongiae]|uniref:glycosyltransferase n=1 Tax=Crateriforma spongiae TaxID=2724528 RepID=UPI00144766DC|nr:glycosyltransferase [Crateriforma spongiae]